VSPRARAFLFSCLALFSLVPSPAAQSTDTEKPVPILTGTAGTFSFVTAGQQQLNAQINPVLLLPLGEHWLVESRAEFQGVFQRPPNGGPYGGPVGKNLDYLEADYIANPYVTVTLGRFLTPFGIFNERLYPIWIRSLQQDPLILPLSPESSDGMMLRGGFPVSAKVNFTYAAYVSGHKHVAQQPAIAAQHRRAHESLPARPTSRDRSLLSETVAGHAHQCFRISLCLAVCAPPAQRALRVCPLQSR
jgi:hypothetical protein